MLAQTILPVLGHQHLVLSRKFIILSLDLNVSSASTTGTITVLDGRPIRTRTRYDTMVSGIRIQCVHILIEINLVYPLYQHKRPC